jgi:Leucine-rich repeat (LRR) protein
MKQLRIFARTLSLLILLVMLVGCSGPKSIFPDKNLEAAIRDALDKPAREEITTAELASLTSLLVNSKAITDLTGLENCINLQGLNLHQNNISDISVLTDLINLQALIVSNNNISDTSALAGLTNLQTLLLMNNSISDISPLAGLTNLQELWLAENNISDISALVENTWLSDGDFVDLSGNPLSATSVNIYIPQLEERGATVTYE